MQDALTYLLNRINALEKRLEKVEHEKADGKAA
jgi:hypothetical protein